MFTRIFDRTSIVVLLALGGCDQSTPNEMLRKVEATVRTDAADRGDVMCARAGETALRRACTIDRTTTHDGLVLTLHQPDGGFRRLLVTRDGRGVVAADGAERAKVSVVGPHEIDVTIGGERYRLPATVGAVTRAAS